MTTLDTDSAPQGLSTLVGFGHSAVGSSRPRETLETLRPVAAVKRAARQDRERHVDTALHDHD